jgi:hypothetical protein
MEMGHIEKYHLSMFKLQKDNVEDLKFVLAHYISWLKDNMLFN